MLTLPQYAFHDGTVGLYFMAFCKTQKPLRERLGIMYGVNGEKRDPLTGSRVLTLQTTPTQPAVPFTLPPVLKLWTNRLLKGNLSYPNSLL